MSIPVTCTCGQQFMAQPHLAGQRVACPNCGSPLTIPDLAEEPESSQKKGAAEGIVSCQCGQSFKAAPHLAGKRVPCPSCGQPIDIPGGESRASFKSAAVPSSPGPKTKQAAGIPTAKTAGKSPSATAPAVAQAPAVGASQAGIGLEWDDALAAPGGTAPLEAFGTMPAYAARRTAPEPIEPMTMYAIWIGVAAVVLLILLILGHIIWKAFSDPSGAETAPAQPVESAPVEPGSSETTPVEGDS
jgi:hypothetical protein